MSCTTVAGSSILRTGTPTTTTAAATQEMAVLSNQPKKKGASVNLQDALQKPFPRGYFLAVKPEEDDTSAVVAGEAPPQLWPCLIFPNFEAMTEELERHHKHHPPREPTPEDLQLGLVDEGFTHEIRTNLCSEAWAYENANDDWDMAKDPIALLIGLNQIMVPLKPEDLKFMYDKDAIQTAKLASKNDGELKFAIQTLTHIVSSATCNKNLLKRKRFVAHSAVRAKKQQKVLQPSTSNNVVPASLSSVDASTKVATLPADSAPKAAAATESASVSNATATSAKATADVTQTAEPAATSGQAKLPATDMTAPSKKPLTVQASGVEVFQDACANYLPPRVSPDSEATIRAKYLRPPTGKHSMPPREDLKRSLAFPPEATRAAAAAAFKELNREANLELNLGHRPNVDVDTDASADQKPAARDTAPKETSPSCKPAAVEAEKEEQPKNNATTPSSKPSADAEKEEQPQNIDTAENSVSTSKELSTPLVSNVGAAEKAAPVQANKQASSRPPLPQPSAKMPRGRPPAKRNPAQEVTHRTPRSTQRMFQPLTKLKDKERNIPTFADVKVLLTNGGFQFAKGKYTFPNGLSFTSEDEFRAHFCAYGLGQEPTNFQREFLDLDTTEGQLLERWVRMSIISNQLKKLPREIDVASSIYHDVMSLGFKKSGAMGYHFPLAKENDTVWRQHGGFAYCAEHDDLYVKLSQFGLPKECRLDALDKEARLRVELYLAFLHRDLLNPNP